MAASVTLFERGKVRSLGVTGPLAAAPDGRQYETGFGPCLQAALSGEAVLIADTAHETVHRDFAALADAAVVVDDAAGASARAGHLRVALHSRGPSSSRRRAC